MHIHLYFWLATAVSVAASDFVRLSPITDKILQVNFDDGHLDYMGKDQNRYDHITVYYSPLALDQARLSASYQLGSSTDPAYQTPLSPITIGRKSKGAEFNNIYQAPAEPHAIAEHSLYLEFSTPLQPGHTYTLGFAGLADNRKSYTFVFDEKYLFSETLHVNQIGFTPASRKYAYLSQWMGDFSSATHLDGGLELDDYAGRAFHLVRYDDREVVFSGVVALRKEKTLPDSTHATDYGATKNFTYADVWECDFSEFRTPGEYLVVVERMGCSFPFVIAEDVYRQAYVHVSKGLFGQRSGIEKEVEPGWVFPRDQHPDMPGKNFYYGSVAAANRVQGIWGWYHDAGDWDGYITHATVPAMLLCLYDLRPANFSDGDVGNRYKLDPASPSWIEEGANGRPDLLDEASWLVECYRRTRQALLAQGFGTGGVPGYYGVDSGYKEKPAWEDPRDLVIEKENATNTLNYAGLAAWYAACLNKFHGGVHPESEAWIAEARDAFAWGTAKGGDLKSRSFAAAALYRITGEATFQSDYQARFQNVAEPGWSRPSMAEFANILYALLPDDHPQLDKSFRQTVRDLIIERVGTASVDYAISNRGFRVPSMNRSQNHSVGTFSAPKTLWIAAAHALTGEDKYLDAIRAAGDYFLGGNEMNLVWMTGVGERSDRAAFHLNSWYTKDYNSMVYVNPIARGLVPYGSYRNCDWQGGCDNGVGKYSWVGDEDFSRTTAYPHVNLWPQAETRFQNRQSIAGSEFTIHQTQNHAIFTMGYLCSQPHQKYVPSRPQVTLHLADNQLLDRDRPCRLLATASADTRRVAYYYDWHFLGESTDRAKGFPLDWDFSQTTLPASGEVLVTAVAYDRTGTIGEPSPQAERRVRFASGQGEVLVALEAAHGSISVVPAATTYAPGTSLTLTATPDAGYRFLGWAGDAEGGENPLTLTVDRNLLLVAQFVSENPWADLPVWQGLRQAPLLGWLYDAAYPWIFSFDFAAHAADVPGAGWLFVVPAGPGESSLFLFSALTSGWLWSGTGYAGWYYQFGEAGGWVRIPTV